MAGNDVERAAADGTGRAEDRHVLDRAHTMFTSAAVGRTGVSASMRSRIPPCPGRRFPLSFRPACRFIADSSKSPSTDSTVRASTSTIIHTGLQGRSRTAVGAAPRKSPIQAAAYTAVAASAPYRPSQVFPGLTFGASLVRPNLRPAKYAALSATQTVPMNARSVLGPK